ncbi:MAG: hypothetical protein ACKO8O_11350 [Betaproteobacteria bacterium]
MAGLRRPAALALAVDVRHIPPLGLPAEWRRLRLHLTAGAVIALLAGAQAALELGA